MKYKGQFRSNIGDKYNVEIITNNDETEEKEIILNTDPFIVKYSGNENIFKPLKLSGATVSCYVDDFMFDIFTGKAKGTKCILYKNDDIEWQGYVTPNIYTQDYLQEKFELEIECVDAISILDYFFYQTNKKDITSFLDVIKKSIYATGLNFNNLYVHAFSDYKLEDLYISEQNWYTEEEDTLSYKEILENILQYLNLTMYQHKDNIYIVDYNLIKLNNYQFHSYNLNTNINSSTAFTLPTIKLEENIIYQTPKISSTEVYNKININSSLYQSDIYIHDISNLDDIKVIGNERTENDGPNTYKIQLLENNNFEFLAKNKEGEIQNIDYSLEIGRASCRERVYVLV